MTGPKTNERPGTRAEARYVRMSAYKAARCSTSSAASTSRQADQVLQFCERDASIPIRKCLASAIANAEHNDSQVPDELYVSACYADEGPTLKRWRPRARGRATRIRKRTCHITVIVSRMPEELLERQRAATRRSRRTAAARRSGQQAAAAASRAGRPKPCRGRDAEPHEPRSRPRWHDHEPRRDDEVVEPRDGRGRRGRLGQTRSTKSTAAERGGAEDEAD